MYRKELLDASERPLLVAEKQRDERAEKIKETASKSLDSSSLTDRQRNLQLYQYTTVTAHQAYVEMPQTRNFYNFLTTTGKITALIALGALILWGIHKAKCT